MFVNNESLIDSMNNRIDDKNASASGLSVENNEAWTTRDEDLARVSLLIFMLILETLQM